MRKIELIELGLNEIARECRIVDGVACDCRQAIAVAQARGKEADKVLFDMQERHDGLLAEIHGKVIDLLETVGEYMNCNEMVTPVDTAINEAVYDLVYGRKTEDDFEEEG